MGLMSCYIKACEWMGSNPGGAGISTIIMPLLSSNFKGATDDIPLEKTTPEEPQLALADSAPAQIMKLPRSGSGFG